MKTSEVFGGRHYLAKMTMPIFLESLLMLLISNIDQIMLSRFSQDAVTAVGNANQFSFFMLMFFNVLATASIILITQYKGSDNVRAQQQVYAIALASNAVIGAVVSLVFLLFSRDILALLNVEEGPVMDAAVSYLKINGAFMVVQALITCYGAFLRSHAMLRHNLVISVAANLLNIIGNAVALYGFDAGVSGVAVSSVLSRFVQLGLMIYVFRKYIGKVQWELLRPLPNDELLKMLRLGVPAAGESMSYQIAQLVVLAFINNMGSSVVNTKIYVGMIANFTYLYCNSIANATQVVEGWMLGARKLDDADSRVMKTLRSGVMVSVALTAVCVIFSSQLLGLFTDDMSVLELGKQILAIELVLEAGRSCNLTLVRALQTAGDVRFPTVMGVASAWLVTVPLSYLLGVVCGFGLAGVWIAFAVDECLRGAVLYFRWKKGTWRSFDLVSGRKEAAAA